MVTHPDCRDLPEHPLGGAIQVPPSMTTGQQGTPEQDTAKVVYVHGSIELGLLLIRHCGGKRGDVAVEMLCLGLMGRWKGAINEIIVSGCRW